MADKEATIYIVDLGRSMGKTHTGRTVSDLDWALGYVWDKITSTVATGRKTLNIGVVGLRTDETKNEMSREENYDNIAILQPISQILLPELRDLRAKLVVNQTDTGDAISAVVVAIKLISEFCKALKYVKRIILVTNARAPIDGDDVEEISSKIKEDGIELFVLGVDFDDPDFGFKEENKNLTKAKNEAALKRLAEESGGIFGTLAQAISELEIPRIKQVRPVPSYRGQLTLGDGEHYPTALSIDVERYPRTKVAAAPSASNFVEVEEPKPGESSNASSTTLQADSGTRNKAFSTQEDLAPVKFEREYEVVDEEKGRKIGVTREELAKGYEYGRTAVHISESDENVTTLGTTPGLEIVGFVDKGKYERYMNLSVASCIVAQKGNDKAAMALSAFVHALYEVESYAVARLVTKADVAPLLLLLAPGLEPDFECLLDVQLPFAEDVRSYKFPPLDKVLTVSGKTLHEHRNLPTYRLTSAMGAYVDSMDLSDYGRDDEGVSAEYMCMEDTFSPVLHRLDHAIRFRAVHPTEPIPTASGVLTRYAEPPPKLLKLAEPHLQELIVAGDVKKVPPKQKGRRRGRDCPQPLSGLDVDELLGRQKRTKISADNAIPEFKQMLATTDDPDGIKDAARQMSTIIATQIRDSLGDSGYGRATEGIRVMREELTAMEEPGVYNAFVTDLKTKIQAGELGGDRREMWWEIRRHRLGLIDRAQSSISDVTEEEAAMFLRGALDAPPTIEDRLLS